MIKKFNEFIKEGYVNNKLPLFFNEKDVYEVVGYPGYYISPKGENGDWQVYHAPKEEPICEYENLAFEPDVEGGKFTFRKGTEYYEDYTILDNNITPEEESIISDDNFIEAIYDTLKNNVY